MDLSVVPGEFLLAGFILFIFVVFGGGIYVSMRQARRRREAILERGLVAQKVPDASLVERMRRLKPDTRLEKVYRLERGTYQLYLLELWSARSSDDEARSYNTIALISPDFHLPRFMLTPKLHVRGLSKLVEWAMQYYAQHYRLQLFSFPENPVFNNEFMLLGQNETALRAAFGLERINRLATAAKNFMVEGQDDLLTFTRADLQHRSNSGTAQVDALLEGAAVLYAIFRA